MRLLSCCCILRGLWSGRQYCTLHKLLLVLRGGGWDSSHSCDPLWRQTLPLLKLCLLHVATCWIHKVLLSDILDRTRCRCANIHGWLFGVSEFRCGFEHDRVGVVFGWGVWWCLRLWMGMSGAVYSLRCSPLIVPSSILLYSRLLCLLLDLLELLVRSDLCRVEKLPVKFGEGLNWWGGDWGGGVLDVVWLRWVLAQQTWREQVGHRRSFTILLRCSARYWLLLRFGGLIFKLICKLKIK